MERQLGAVLRQVYSSMIIDEVRFGLSADVRTVAANDRYADKAVSGAKAFPEALEPIATKYPVLRWRDASGGLKCTTEVVGGLVSQRSSNIGNGARLR